jgi:hypothetical protein
VVLRNLFKLKALYSPDVSPPSWSYSEEFLASRPNCNVKHHHLSPAGVYLFSTFCIYLPQLVGVSSQSEDMEYCDNKEPRPV